MTELRFHEDADRAHPSVQPFLARIDDVRALHERMGLTEEESWETLQDLPRHAHLDRLLHGSPGLRKDWWVELAFSGALVQLGRLQYEPREGYLNLHVPEEGGPLAPAAVDASLARAREVFPGVPEARITSWLLDPQLREVLGDESNIVRFAARFDRLEDDGVDDDRVVEFVFHTLRPQLDELPQQTRLQRAIVEHLRSGGHFHSITGSLAL